MISLKPNAALVGLALLLIWARPALAFGAGNIAGISKVEGQNWRHGDIEDALLSILMARAVGGEKFNKLMVSRTYFGNWLRDYSQAIDVGTVKSVSAEAIRLLLCVLGFMTFGYGSGEFEVTAERLGCYRPEDHIDNPKNYADNMDATQYDERLRGPVDESVELAIDEETGMKNYIANEQARIMTSAYHVRRLFGQCIKLGRKYRRDNDKRDFYEALRLMGTGLHCLEDFLAHSNYVELALIEMGERDVFAHVGSRTRMRLPGVDGHVWPCVTGTFGGVDFLHSVAGEVSDKLTQNEIQELEGTLQQNANNDNSVLEDLLDKIPDGMFGGDDKKGQMHEIQDNANNAQMENTSISPREPEEFTQYIQQVFEKVMPAIKLHDDIMQSISEAIEKIPVLPKLVENLEEQMSKWVFTIMAPFVVPIIKQVKNELRTGSEEIIESSKNEQHIVFNDDECTDPTHSMLSKDHFSNILNEIAGKTASKVVHWVVPKLMRAWDDDGVDINRMMTRIITGVLHHPAQRDQGEDGAREGRQIMFREVEEWWSQMDEGAKDEYRRKLSRDGVENGENHKEGVHDTGHGCGKPLGMHKNFAQGGTMEDKIAGEAANAIFEGATGMISDFVDEQSGGQVNLPGGSRRDDQDEGAGGLIGKIGSSLLGGAFGKDKDSFEEERRSGDGSVTESRTEYGRSGNRYEQAEYSDTRTPDGGERREYDRYEQDDAGRGYGYQERTETRPSYGGGFEERTERRFESNEDSYEESSGWERRGGDGEGGFGGPRGGHRGGRGGGPRGGRGHHQGGGGGREHSRERQRENERREEYGGGEDYGRQQESYGGRQEYGGGEDYGRRQEFGGGRQEFGGGRQEYGGGGGEEYGRRQEFGGGEDYGRQQEFGGGGEGYGRRQERRDDDDSGSGGGGFLGDIVNRIGDELDDSNGDRRERRGGGGGGGGWGF
ncbi:Het-C-domain-containing protein [Xylariaceae sp. FL0804]|nr:Het-C-domain-containing protein [Xylariaceae sp. FL0804]